MESTKIYILIEKTAMTYGLRVSSEVIAFYMSRIDAEFSAKELNDSKLKSKDFCTFSYSVQEIDGAAAVDRSSKAFMKFLEHKSADLQKQIDAKRQERDEDVNELEALIKRQQIFTEAISNLKK